jgi:hypothetical protein
LRGCGARSAEGACSSASPAGAAASAPPADLVDEAASRLRIEIDSLPLEIDTVERRVTQLQIERQALKKEKAAPVAS